MRDPRAAGARGLSIGLMGTRGIPANYGGFETFYENLSWRLVERGHRVTVYNRVTDGTRLSMRVHRGVRLVPLPSIHTKHFDTISHTMLSVLHGVTQRYDVVYICGVGNAPIAWVPKLGRARVVLNVDSADWKRDKWGPRASAYLRASEKVAGRTADLVVADNDTIRLRYQNEYGTEAVFIPYGANLGRVESTAALESFGLVPGRYILWVGRLEPETRVEELVTAFDHVADGDIRLVVVGDAPFADHFKDRLTREAGPRVVFAGYQYGLAYRELSSHALAYVQTSPTAGTSPALLDQMGAGNATIARGTPANKEVVADAGLTYDPENPIEDLARTLRNLIENPGLRAELGRRAIDRVRSHYSWDSITERYESLFMDLVRTR